MRSFGKASLSNIVLLSQKLKNREACPPALEEGGPSLAMVGGP